MSRLAPARKHDMEMLVKRRAKSVKYSKDYDGIQRKIEHILAEGKDPLMHSLRHRLLGAHAAQDQPEIEKISKQIDRHVKKHGRQQRWLKKG